MRMIAPYHWGHRRWQDHLADTQQLIYSGARAQVEATDRLRGSVESVGAETLRASNARQEELLGLFHQQAVASGVAWERIEEQLETLVDTVAGGFSTLASHLEYHAILLSAVASKLDSVVFALEHPLTVAAKELFHSGRLLLSRRLYSEALSDFLASEEKRPVNPLLHLHLAQLYYSVRDEKVPFDYELANKHAALAIRYVRSVDQELLDDGTKSIDLVYRTAAHIAFVKSADLSIGGLAEESRWSYHGHGIF